MEITRLGAVGFEPSDRGTRFSVIMFKTLDNSECQQHYYGIHYNHNCAIAIDQLSYLTKVKFPPINGKIFQF